MKVAIITGATSGMGMEAALQIDERFISLDEIWIIGRNEKKLDELAEKLTHSVRIFSMDLTKEEELDAFEEILKELNPNIRMLFNGAGAGLHGKFEEISRKEEIDLIRLNCESLTAMTSICIPYMRKGARILQFASIAAFAPFPGYGVYGATKAYVLNFSRALRFELRKKGIVVTAVCPGPVNTAFFDNSEKYSGGVSNFKRKFMDKPDKVVKKALNDAGLALPISINRPIWEASALIAKHSPVEPFVYALGMFDEVVWDGKKNQ